MPIPTVFNHFIYFIILVKWRAILSPSLRPFELSLANRWATNRMATSCRPHDGRALRSQWPFEMSQTINRAHSSLGHKSYVCVESIFVEQRRRSKCAARVNGVPVSMNNNFLPPHTPQPSKTRFQLLPIAECYKQTKTSKSVGISGQRISANHIRRPLKMQLDKNNK